MTDTLTDSPSSPTIVELGGAPPLKVRIERAEDTETPVAWLAPESGTPLKLAVRQESDGALVGRLDFSDPIAMSEAGAFVGGGESLGLVTAVLAAIGNATGVTVKSLELGLTGADEGLAFYRITAGNTKPWAIAGSKLQLKSIDAQLSVYQPSDPEERTLRGTLGCDLAYDTTDIAFQLTNEVSERNPDGQWLLMPKAESFHPKLGTALSWITEGSRAAVESALPAWAKAIDDEVDLFDVALTLDVEGKTLSRLTAGVRWTRPAEMTAGKSAAVSIEQALVGLDLTHPFDGEKREATFSFLCSARIFEKRFTLTGKASSGGAWSLSGLCNGKLSITTAISALCGAITGDAKDLFGDFDLSLQRPSVTLGSGSMFRVDSQVLVGTKGAPTIGGLTFEPATLRAEGRGTSRTYELDVALSLKQATGPSIERARLRVEHTSDSEDEAAASTEVSLSGRVRFPVKGGDDVVADLSGGYQSAKGFFFKSTLGAISLNPLLSSWIGELPARFPTLRSKALTLEIETRSGYFHFNGGVQIDDLDFTLDIRIHSETKETSIAAAVSGDVKLGAFLKAFGLQDKAGDDGDAKLTGAGFRYRSSKDESGFQIVATWPGGGQLSIGAIKDQKAETPVFKPFVLVRPGDAAWLEKAELSWSGAEQKDVTLFLPPKKSALLPKETESGQADAATTSVEAGDKIDVLPRGLAGKADFRLPKSLTKYSERLGLKEQLHVELRDGLLKLGDSTAEDKKSGDSAGAESEAKPEAKPDEGLQVDTALSLGPVTVDRIRLKPQTKPKPALTVAADINLNLPPYVSAKVKGLSVTLTPDKLSLEDVQIAKDFSFEGAALVVTVPGVAKVQAGVLYSAKELERPASNTSSSKITTPIYVQTISGVGKLEILQKLEIAALVHFQWHDRALKSGFGFVYAKGFAIGLPPVISVTGIAGGYGHNCTIRLPTRAQEVENFQLMAMLMGSGDDETKGGEADALLKRLEAFQSMIEYRKGAFCVAFGLTFRIAEMIDGAALVIAQARNPGFELTLMGLARFDIGAKEKKLGRVELALMASYSSTDGCIKILGALTDRSWLLDEKCKLQGGFGIAIWTQGEQAGDFVVSIGGYSPLVPKKPHYPALDRVGFDWKIDEDKSLHGNTYFAIDRYGLQFGLAGGFSYSSDAALVEASFSLDALIEWSPLFFEMKMRIGVHVELRKVVTMRLGLDVEMHAYGPSFGARVTVAIDLWLFKPTFTVQLGPTYEEARAALKRDFKDVLALALGGRTSVLSLGFARDVGAGEGAAPGGAKTNASLDADSVAIDLGMAIPVRRVVGDGATALTGTIVSRGEVTPKHGALTLDDRLDVRPMKWEGVESDLALTLTPDKGGEAFALDLRAQARTPLESLWYIAGAGEGARDSKRKAFEALRVGAPRGVNSGASFEKVALKNEIHPHPAKGQPTPTNVDAAAAPSPWGTTDVKQPDAEKRKAVLKGLSAFGLSESDDDAGTAPRVLEKKPLRAA